MTQITPISATASATIKMAYNSRHQLISQTDADGNTTTYEYSNGLLNEVYPPGARNSRPHPGDLQRVGRADEAQRSDRAQPFHVRQCRQPDEHRGAEPVSGTALNGPGTRATYDEAGDVTTRARTPTGTRRPASTYDAAGDLLTTVAPGPQTTTNSYDLAGDATGTTDAAGNTTAYSWDEGTLTRTSVTNGGSPSTNVFDPSGNLLSESAKTRRIAPPRISSTASGARSAKTDPSNITTQYTYDLLGNVVAQSDNAGDVLAYQFDAVNRPVRQVDNGAVTLTGYDPAGNVVSTTDPAGAVTTTAYTAQGKPASVTDAAGTTRYAYDLANGLVATTDPDGHVTNYTNDGAGRQTSVTSNGHTTSYTYDNNGNVKTVTDPDGHVRRHTPTTASTNPSPRPSRQTGQPTLTVGQSYDALGRRVGLTDPDGTQHTYSYDVAGDLTKATSGSDTFTYNYSQPGKILEAYPDGTNVTYSVDDSQNLMSVQSGTQGDPGYVQASYIRNPLRETTGVSLSNGIFENQTVNQSGQVLDQSLQMAGTRTRRRRLHLRCQRQPAGPVAQALGTTTTNQYSYNGSERLTGFSTSTAPSTIGASSTNNTAPSSRTATFATSRRPRRRRWLAIRRPRHRRLPLSPTSRRRRPGRRPSRRRSGARPSPPRRSRLRRRRHRARARRVARPDPAPHRRRTWSRPAVNKTSTGERPETRATPTTRQATC